MMKSPTLEGCEKNVEGTDQTMNEVLILPCRFVKPVVLYKKNKCGKRSSSTIGYKVKYRHFRHSLLPFHKPDKLKNIELYMILLTGECQQVPVRTVFRETMTIERALYFIPE